jgi:predicted RNA-binding protein YlqC (UPF0109 family)
VDQIIIDILKDHIWRNVENLVSEPNKIKIDSGATSSSIIFDISTASAHDSGRILGRHGVVLEAIRTIGLAIISAKVPKDSQKINLHINVQNHKR